MRLVFILVSALYGSLSFGGEVLVTVTDNRGAGVADLVVEVVGVSAAPSRNGAPTASMDQVDKRFVPEILVVRTGTAVAFPNSDSVAHQVYSFSPTKRFTLPLYRGRAHPPLIFDRPGVVVLGCNIHDQMIGYIYVTDSPYFAKTDGQGRATISGLPVGGFKLNVWHVRLDERIEQQEIKFGEPSESKQVSIRLQKPLRSAPRPVGERVRDY